MTSSAGFSTPGTSRERARQKDRREGWRMDLPVGGTRIGTS
jgi:hypothetical protein